MTPGDYPLDEDRTELGPVPPDPEFSPGAALMAAGLNLLVMEDYETACAKVEGAEDSDFVEFLTFQDDAANPGRITQHRVRFRRSVIAGVNEVTEVMWRQRIATMREVRHAQSMMAGGLVTP